MSENVTITVPGVDIDQLREQRDHILRLQKGVFSEKREGLINLLDTMLDIAEGYDDGL